jgi:hypothetical protein
MHSNYPSPFTRKAFTALPHLSQEKGPILSNRRAADVCAQRDERHFGGLS